jgi:hypothetical protein
MHVSAIYRCYIQIHASLGLNSTHRVALELSIFLFLEDKANILEFIMKFSANVVINKPAVAPPPSVHVAVNLREGMRKVECELELTFGGSYRLLVPCECCIVFQFGQVPGREEKTDGGVVGDFELGFLPAIERGEGMFGILAELLISTLC